MASSILFFPLLLLAACDAGSLPVQLHGKGTLALSDPSASKSNVSTISSVTHSRSTFINATHFALADSLRTLGSDCGSPAVAAALASLAAYDSGNVEGMLPKAQVDKVKGALQSSGFSQSKQYRITQGKCQSLINGEELDETDAAFLWKRASDRHCLLSFRGSNCVADGFVLAPAAIFKYGHTINQDALSKEFEPLLAKMTMADFSDCNTLHVTGHSLGAGLASIFAVLSNADELELGKSVDAVYLMSPAQVFKGTMPTNGKSEDGCFAGGMYCNYVEDGGELKVDWVCQAQPGGGYTQPKTDYIKIGAASGTTACAQVTPEFLKADPVMHGLPVHIPQHYVNGQGCSEATVPLPH